MYYEHLGTSKKCPDYQKIFPGYFIGKGANWDHNQVSGLCGCPYFQVSTLIGSTVCLNFQYTSQ